MPSPKFTFRLPQKDKDALIEMAKLYGAASPGAFVAEVVGAMCSGDMERIKALNGRLIARMGEQLTLKLNAAMDAAVDSHTESNGTPKRVRKKRRRPRDRAT